MAKIGEAIESIGDFIANSVRRATSSDFAKDATFTIYDKVVRKAGKAVGNTALKVGASTMKTAANTVDGIRNNKEAYKKVGKAIANFGGETVKEASTFVHAGAGAIEVAKKMGILESTMGNLDKSLVGIKFTAGAKFALLPAAAAVGAIGGTKDYMTNRQGRNDGQTYQTTPSMTNPYEISQQMAYSQSGRSFSQNAGADGDLVRAISNMR